MIPGFRGLLDDCLPGFDPDRKVVASTGIDQEFHLASLAMDLAGADYDPNQFPGFVYRLDEPNVVVLLFGSGKLVITGATQRDDATEALTRVQSRLEELSLLG